MSGCAIILCATPAADSQLRSWVASCYADSRAKAELRHRELHSLSRDPISARQGFVLWDAVLREGCEQQQKSLWGCCPGQMHIFHGKVAGQQRLHPLGTSAKQAYFLVCFQSKRKYLVPFFLLLLFTTNSKSRTYIHNNDVNSLVKTFLLLFFIHFFSWATKF